MRIIISFEAENDAFCADFDNEIKRIMKQATEFLVNERNSELLFDTNGHKVGFVYRSSIIRPRRNS